MFNIVQPHVHVFTKIDDIVLLPLGLQSQLISRLKHVLISKKRALNLYTVYKI